MKLVDIAIRQPITIAVGVILALLAGLVALNRVPVAMTPEVEDLVIAVTTSWENASPQEIETEVIDPQEERLQGVANLRAMTSISQRGQGQIRLEFRTGTDKAVALQEVSDKLREVPNYPDNVDEPVIEDTDPESRDYIAWIVLSSSDPNFDVTTLYNFVDKRVRPIYERLPGVSEVGVRGGREREMQIRFDPVLLAQRSVTMAELFATLSATNRNFSAGALPEGKSDIRVRALGRYRDQEQILNTVIRHDDTGPVYIRDIASVVESFKEPTSLVTARGVRVIAINFQREIGSNVLEVMKQIKATTAQLNAPGALLDYQAQQLSLDGKLELVQTYDQTIYIDQALELVRGNILIGGLLAVFTLILFLRSLRSVGIIGIAIPISVISSAVIIVALGRSINVVSLAGIAFAVGMVVDNAIVVLENIYRHLEMGKNRLQAAFEGTTEVAGAVLASTLTTLVVFIPILLIQETAGQLFRDIAIAICAAVGMSYVVSITVIPCAGALILRPQVRRPGQTSWCDRCPDSDAAASRFKLASKATGRFVQTICTVSRVSAKLPQAIGALIYRLNGSAWLRGLVVTGFVTVTVIGIARLMPPLDYLPAGNRNIVFGLLLPPAGYNMGQLNEIAGRLQNRVQPFWQASPQALQAEAFSLYGAPGPNSPRPYPLPLTSQPDGPKVVPPPLAHYFVVSWDGLLYHVGISGDGKRTVDLLPLFSHATAPEVTPGILSFNFQLPLFRTGGTTGSAVKIDLTGPDLDAVSRSAAALFGHLAQEFGMQAIQPEPANFNIPSPELQIVPDMIALSDSELTVQDLGYAVQANGDGALFADEFDYRGELIDLKVIAKDAVDQSSLTGLADIPLATPQGTLTSIGSIARLVRIAGPEQIKRVGRERAVTLQFTPPPGLPLQEAIDRVYAMLGELRDEGAIAPGIQAQLAGSASKLNEIKTALLGDGTLTGTITSSLFLALTVVYLLMCVLFQSWSYPLVIMVSVPLATLGGFLALAGVHAWSAADRYMPVQNLDVLTILGFVILAGVVVNNAILLVHQSLNLISGRAADCDDCGLPPREAIAKAVESRVRPIMMSTLTSVGGMLPLVLMPGSGSELYRGLGAVVLGGLVVSTVFTLILVPLLFGMLLDLKGRLAARKTAPSQPEITQPETEDTHPKAA